MRVPSVLVMGLLLASCRPDGVVGVDAEWSVAPTALDLGGVYVGAERAGALVVRNESRAALTLSVEMDGPFSVPASVTVGGGETLEVLVTIRARRAGDVTGVAHLSDGKRVVDVALSARGLPIPDCGAPAACRELRFDAALGMCVEAPAADGVACASACLVDATCRQGECVGAARRCDDGNPCTADHCDAEIGCVHDDATPACPASVDPCRVAVCRAPTGCDFDEAADGTPCGPNDCTTAHVCIAGHCASRAAPEGSQCAAAGVCRAPATCRQSACVAGPVTYPAERWRHAPAGRRLFFGGTVDPFGTAYFTEAPLTDATGALELVAIDRDGRERLRVELARPCLRCSARLMLAPADDLILVGRQGLVEARSLSTGALRWSRDTRLGKTPRSPQPDGGAAWSSAAFIALGPGLVVEHLSEGSDVHRQYAVALELATGHVAWERDWWGHVYSPGATTANELWVAAADCWAPVTQVEVVDARGFTARTVPRAAKPIGYFEDAALLQSGGSLAWSSPAGTGASLPVSPGGSPWALTTPGRTVLVSYQSALGLDGDGGLRWTRGLPGYVGTGALVVDGGTLFSASADDGGSTLLGFDEHGATILDCPLPGRSAGGTPTHNLWVTQVSKGGADALVAFDIPGAVPEARGWVTPAGSGFGDFRPR